MKGRGSTRFTSLQPSSVHFKNNKFLFVPFSRFKMQTGRSDLSTSCFCTLSDTDFPLSPYRLSFSTLFLKKKKKSSLDFPVILRLFEAQYPKTSHGEGGRLQGTTPQNELCTSLPHTTARRFSDPRKKKRGGHW